MTAGDVPAATGASGSAAAGPVPADLPPFDLCGPLPTGTTLLEASAGTGKTFTIAALTARYIAEGVAELSQIMLVTFGSAASRELRDRVRERLVGAELALREPLAARGSPDEVLAHLADVPDEEVERRRQRLATALATFDSATIATTHSFCSRMLAGLGLVADADTGATFVASIDDLVREVVDDLYLRTFGRPGAEPPGLTHAEMLELGRRAVGSDRSSLLHPLDAPGLPGQRRAAAQAVRDEVAERKRRRGLVDYDDWLVLLRDALSDAEHGPVARERLREHYRVVLVDEFQDTDPVQWEVLRLGFHDAATLVLIGDPKQAVYAFRGGDVTTYLAASAVAGTRATLSRNWRSDRALLDGLGLLLGGAALGAPEIVVRPVQAVQREDRLTGAGAPVRLRQLARRGHGPLIRGLPRVDPVREMIAGDVADDVVRLLTGPARLHGEPVEPGDVAVLVRTNRQGLLIRDALSRAGVPAVLAGGGSVLATDSARSWLVLLEAMEQPHRPGRVRAAALSVFLGVPAAELDRAGADPEGSGDVLSDRLGGRLRAWAQVLAERGVAAFFELLTAQERLPARVLAQPGGERLLTDLRHIAQALHAVAREQALGLTALTEWLRRRIAQAAVEAGDERTRRLDSDAAAVQVMTVHVSKGLEFPVVYVPFAWDRWSPTSPDPLRLHDEQGRRVLDVGGPDAPGYSAARARHAAEEAGEELRLLYVAVTRAQCQVVAHWAPTGNTPTAPLHRLLFGLSAAGSEPPPSLPVPPDDAVQTRLSALAASSAGTIAAESAVPGPALHRPPSPGDTAEFAVARFTRSLDRSWRRTSYSALTAGAHEAVPAVNSEPEAPAKDDEQDRAADPAAGRSLEVPAGAVVSPLGALPGGTAFGLLVHEVLEDLSPEQLGERCRASVARRPGSGIDPDLLSAGLSAVLGTPLAPLAVTLGSIDRRDRLAELSFELPLPDGSGREVRLGDLADLLRSHDLGPVTGYADALDQLDPQLLRGYLTGSIDALLRLPGPSYAVVDYKTNRLGGDPLTSWHYRQEALAEQMQRSHYVLQALLYSVAVHRYLRWRQPGYDPGRHLGPVLYLFVRGMCGPDSPPGSGVFAWQPPVGLVPQLSDLLAGTR